MLPVGFEPTVSAGERPPTQDLLGHGYNGARKDTTQQSGQTPGKDTTQQSGQTPDKDTTQQSGQTPDKEV